MAKPTPLAPNRATQLFDFGRMRDNILGSSSRSGQWECGRLRGVLHTIYTYVQRAKIGSNVSGEDPASCEEPGVLRWRYCCPCTTPRVLLWLPLLVVVRDRRLYYHAKQQPTAREAPERKKVKRTPGAVVFCAGLHQPLRSGTLPTNLYQSTMRRFFSTQRVAAPQHELKAARSHPEG
jgi:hypothetical protein